MIFQRLREAFDVQDALCSCLRRRLFAGALSLCALACLGGCAGAPSPSIAVTESVKSSDENSAYSAASEYRLGSGDKIKLTVYGEDDLSGEFQIGGNGVLSLPLVGQVQVGGTTIPEFETLLTGKLQTYFRHPRVNVQVLNYRPFYIQGEVKNAGEYSYSNGLLVRDAIAKAGGYTYRASTSYAFIRHAAEHEEKRYSLDTPVYVAPGDNIRIDERFF
jgi:protein involved in polysaccharide export with SLBB domain